MFLIQVIENLDYEKNKSRWVIDKLATTSCLMEPRLKSFRFYLFDFLNASQPFDDNNFCKYSSLTNLFLQLAFSNVYFSKWFFKIKILGRRNKF